MTIHETIKWLKNPWHRILRDRIEELIAYVEKHEDDTQATVEWATKVLLTGYLWCDSENEWFIGEENIGELSRGQVRRIASGLCIPIEEPATKDA